MQMPTPEKTFKTTALWFFGFFVLLFIPEIIAFLWVG